MIHVIVVMAVPLPGTGKGVARRRLRFGQGLPRSCLVRFPRVGPRYLIPQLRRTKVVARGRKWRDPGAAFVGKR